MSGLLLAAARHTIPANAVFTAAELDERIAALSARLLAAEPPADGVILCIACPASAPRGSGRTIRRLGWMARKLRRCPDEIEVVCPACFGRWGWGDGG